mmetsp:Transcript_36690/g.67267  ORF Transcript_36690/g.67267 Transcript_36690/m.67267 type:complete len:851 (+) Transcript_36690:116-2668(+)
MFSIPSTKESLPARPPSGALRPPVAVGPLDAEGVDAGTFNKPAFSSGGGSEFLMGLPKSSSAGYGGWNPEGFYGGAMPASMSHPSSGSGVWSTGGAPALPSGGWAVAEVGFDLPVPVGGQVRRPGRTSAEQKADLVAELTTLGRGPSSFPNSEARSEAPTEIMEAPLTGDLRTIPPPEGLLQNTLQGQNPWASGSNAWQQKSYHPTSLSRGPEAFPSIARAGLPSVAPPSVLPGALPHSPAASGEGAPSAPFGSPAYASGMNNAPFGSPGYASSFQPSSGAAQELGQVGVPVPVIGRTSANGFVRSANLGIPGARVVAGTGADFLGRPPMQGGDLFNMLDQNHDGVISRAEFEQALAPLPYRRHIQGPGGLPGVPVDGSFRPPPSRPYGAAPFGSPDYVAPPDAPPATEWGTPPVTGDLPLIAPPPQPAMPDAQPFLPIPPVQDVIAPYQPPLPPAPLPPSWQGGAEKRPHILEVQLDELQVSKTALKALELHNGDLAYFVSLHPVSDRLDTVRLPLEAPRQTREGIHMVSRVLPAKHLHQDPGVEKVDTFYCARFEERLETRLDQLDLHLVAYLWANKGGGYFSAGDVTLLGRGALPLRDFNLQRRPTKWGIFNVASGDKVAELHLTYEVSTTPGPTLNPVLTDVKETEVTCRWSPPTSDHGAQVTGYKVSIMLEGYSGNDWYTLCEQTKSSNPVYVVTNLKGNKKYLMDIRAINKVGVGDESVFEIATAPTPPDPPSKPWIEEVREGCLCVAWTPPQEDGGAQITAYKVKMRKILGATRYGFWSGAPAWVDMGTVGAAMNQHVVDQPSVYTAWVGPLEQATCEYRFQVVALNRAGVSEPSQLSDAHYT